MLGNEVALWELMLAGMKLAAVIIPSTTQLVSADLADRIERGNANWVITSHEHVAKFDTVPGVLPDCPGTRQGDRRTPWTTPSTFDAPTGIQPSEPNAGR